MRVGGGRGNVSEETRKWPIQLAGNVRLVHTEAAKLEAAWGVNRKTTYDEVCR